MATTIKNYITSWILIFVLGTSTFGQSLSEAQARQAWLESSLKFVGIRERTNHNDHDSIFAFNKYAGVPIRSPYCAAGLNYAAYRAHIHFPLRGPAQVRNWFVPKTIIWDRYKGKVWRMPPQQMDVVWLFGSHIEAIMTPIRRDIEDDDDILTIAFNTTANTGKKHGVYSQVRRKWRNVQRVANPFLLGW